MNSLTGWQRLKEPKSFVSQRVGGWCVTPCVCAYVGTRGCKRQSGFHFPTACYRWQHERRHAKGKGASAAERKAGELKVASAWGKVDEGSGFQQRMCV